MNLKELKRLAAACRKAGISHFKSADYEFTLTEEQPKSTYRRNKAELSTKPSQASDSRFESDTLEDDALLFWSTANPIEALTAPAEDSTK